MSELLINDNIVSHSSQRGVTRCFDQICHGLINALGKQSLVFSPRHLELYDKARYFQAIPRTTIRGLGRLLLTSNEVLVANLVRSRNVKVIYSPYYGNLRSKSPQVFIVHDMIHEILHNQFDQRSRGVKNLIAEKKRCIEHASMLIAVSHNTAKDIQTVYPNVPKERIAVVPHGVNEFFFRQESNFQATEERPYLLFVGHRDLYKNFLGFIRGFGISKLAALYDVVVVSPSGSSAFSPDEITLIGTFGIQNHVRLLTNIDEYRLRDLYARSAAFIYPSQYEGFGLPILEALASGTLVATSNTSSMPEVGGEPAFYFDPANAESIAECLRKIADLTVEDRENRIQAGRNHAKTFSWQKSQQKTLEILNQFL